MNGAAKVAIRKFIAENFMYREGLSSIDDDDSLLDKGLIDSTGVLELVFFLEKDFSIKVNDDEVLPDNLDSVNRITDFVLAKAQPKSQVQVA